MSPSDFGDRHGGGDFFPPPSAPRSAVGGIRLQARRSERSWWSKRWLAALEAMGIGDRIERGLDYARSGQVLTLDVAGGVVRATIQGTRRTPYELELRVEVLQQLTWLAVVRELATRSLPRAELLGGRMPEDIEAVCARADVALFPSLESDLDVRCTCADWASPCKHAAAVCHLLGEAFDRDPFLVFQLRGIEREVLLALLAGTPVPDGFCSSDSTDGSDVDRSGATMSGVDLDAFWNGTEPDLDAAPTGTEPPAMDAPLERMLGAPPMWRGAADFLPTMRRLHARVAADDRLLDVALGVPLEPGLHLRR